VIVGDGVAGGSTQVDVNIPGAPFGGSVQAGATDAGGLILGVSGGQGFGASGSKTQTEKLDLTSVAMAVVMNAPRLMFPIWPANR